MLEARQISGDYNYELKPVIKRKKNVRKASLILFRIAVVTCILFAVVTGLMLTATHTQIIQRSDKIAQIKGEISDLQNANERLKLEIACLKSLDRIELIAKKELGMIQPGLNSIVYMAFDDVDSEVASGEALEGENKGKIEVQSNRMVHRAILAVNKMVTNYVLDVNRSERNI